MTGLILQYAYTYTDANRMMLKKYGNMQELSDFLKKENLVEKFASYADKNGLKRRNLMIKKSHTLLKRFIESRIIYNMLDEEAWTEYLNLDDPTIIKAEYVFRNNAAFPSKNKVSVKKK